ncbi:hypothetical protein GCM10027040_29780 [Halomonas shantousis]
MSNSVIPSSDGWYLIQKGPQGGALVHKVACWEVRDAEVIGLVSGREEKVNAEGRPILSVPDSIAGRYAHISQFNSEQVAQLQEAMRNPGNIRYVHLIGADQEADEAGE